MAVHPGAKTGVWECSESFLIACANLFNDENVKSIETGIGLSTAVFCNLGWDHISISPSADEAKQIKMWCAENSVPLNNLSIITDYSYNAPYFNEIDKDLDFVFIDGNHGFPHPFLDYFYLSRKLKVGGYLAIDDLEIESPRYLFKQIQKKPYWRIVALESKWVILQLISENMVSQEDWDD
jgi:hypothetical protein